MYVIALLVIVVKNAAGLAASPHRLRARIHLKPPKILNTREVLRQLRL